MISKSLSTSEKYAGLVSTAGPLAEFCHALYGLLVPHTDDFGRLQGDLFTVKHQCYPASPRSLEEFATALQLLHDAELIIWYAVQGKRFVQVTNFDPHQSGLHKRTRSKFPDPGDSGNPRDTTAPVATLPSEGKGRELNRREGNLETSAEPNGSTPPARGPLEVRGAVEDAVLVFPVVGPGPKTWPLLEADVAEWVAAYPDLDVVAEARRALVWIQAKPGHRKTASGMKKFLVGWLSRTTDRGTTAAAARTARPTARSRPVQEAPPHGGSPGHWWNYCTHEPRCQAFSECVEKNDAARARAGR